MHTLFQPGERGFIITDIGRLIYKVFEQKSEALGYTKFHCQILAYLTHHPGTMQAVLASQIEVEPITLSRHLDRLEHDGLLERQSDVKDRRVKRLTLTPKGEAQMVELMAVRDEIVNAIYLSLNEKDVEHLRQTLTEVRRNLLEMVK